MIYLLTYIAGIATGFFGVLILALFSRKEPRTIEDLREQASRLSEKNKQKTGL